jgi:hypothetical protein
MREKVQPYENKIYRYLKFDEMKYFLHNTI